MGSKRISIALITIVLCGLAATAKPNPAKAARGMLVGIYDPVQPLATPDADVHDAGQPAGPDHPAEPGLEPDRHEASRPTPTDPADPAYDWSTYDRAVVNAAKNKIQVLFTIYGTPRWAQTGKKGVNRAPTKMKNLRYFALRRGEALQRHVQA